MKHSEHRLLITDWILAAGAVLLAAGTRASLAPVLDHQSPYLLFTLAVMWASYRGGLRLGAFTTVLSLVAGFLLFLAPQPEPVLVHIPYYAEAIRGALFMVTGLGISALADRLYRSQAQSARRAEALQQATTALESELTRRQELERALAQKEHYYRTIVESLEDYALLTLDADGIIVAVEGGTEQILGWSREELIGQHFRIVFPPEEAPVRSSVREISEAQRLGLGLAIDERWHIRKDGTRFWASGAVRPLATNHGYFLKVMRDLTTRKRLEDRLQRQVADLAHTDQAKTQFLAMLAHELRNPLASITNAAYILGCLPETSREDTKAQRTHTILKRQVAHLSRMVDDLLDVSRITSGKIELRKSEFDLREVVHDAANATRIYVEGKNHDLRIQTPDTPVWVYGDPTRIEQVLANLIHNAVKYTDAGGRIWVVVLTEDRGGQPWATVRVRDTGTGIAPELLPRVFDLFSQAEPTIDRSQGGLGLGLTLVRQLVQMHDGEVSVSSFGVGHGTEFMIELPATGSTAEPELTLPPPVYVPPATGGKRILIVEDNPGAAETLAELLDLWGHDYQVVHDGPSAVHAAPAFRPDVILLDIGLPGLDGYEVCRRLRKVPVLDGCCLIAVTGYGQSDDRRRSEQAGFDYHLVKPVNPEELQRLLGICR